MLVGLVTAWRFASWPTTRSPVLLKPTTEGTVRLPSELGMTVGSPPSITATTEFVVPRSMPMILPMFGVSPWSSGVGMCSKWWMDQLMGPAARSSSPADGDRHERGPDDPVAERGSRGGSPRRSRPRRGRCPGRSRPPRAARGSNGVPGVASSGLHALALEEQAQLAVDRRDALGPRVVRERLRAVVDRAVEVVGELRGPCG